MADNKQQEWADRLHQAKQRSVNTATNKVRGAVSPDDIAAPPVAEMVGDMATAKRLRAGREQLAAEELLRQRQKAAQAEALRAQAQNATVNSISAAAQQENIANAERDLQASHPEVAQQIADAQSAAAMESVIENVARNQQLSQASQLAARSQIADRLQRIINRHKPFKYSLALIGAVIIDLGDLLIDTILVAMDVTLILTAIGVFLQFCYGLLKVGIMLFLRMVLSNEDRSGAKNTIQTVQKVLFYFGIGAEALPIAEDLPMNSAYVLYAWAKAFKDAQDAKQQLARL